MCVCVCVSLKWNYKILQSRSTFEFGKNIIFLRYYVVPASFSITLSILQVEKCVFFKVEFCVEVKTLENLQWHILN